MRFRWETYHLEASYDSKQSFNAYKYYNVAETEQ